MATHSNFTWYELVTSDTAAAADFYSAVLGWTPTTMPSQTADGNDYTVFSIPGHEMGVGGMMALRPEMIAGGARPAWVGYVYADDVDAKAAEFKENGGVVHMGPMDIPNIGRFAVVADPHGAVLYIFKPNMPDGPMPEEPPVGTPGTVGWRELYAGNAEEAFEFYSKMFGWQKSQGVDMGPMGVYQLFSVDGQDIGGMMTKLPEMHQPFWNYYFVVTELDKAIDIVKAKGGTIIIDPHQVPGGSWIVQAFDPQGAMFSLTSMTR